MAPSVRLVHKTSQPINRPKSSACLSDIASYEVNDLTGAYRMSQSGAVRAGIATAGSAIGRAMSLLLAAGNRLVGGALSRVLSTRVQRFCFIALARLNAPAFIGMVVVALLLTGWVYPYSELVTSLGLLAALLPSAMWLRLAPRASLLVSSVYGRQLRVHLPDTHLTARDVASFRKQIVRLVRVAQLARAKTLHFDSPLLVADSTRQHLLRYLAGAASLHGAIISFEVADAREVDATTQGSLSVHAERYGVLRDGRIATGPSGRLLSRRILAHMHYA